MHLGEVPRMKFIVYQVFYILCTRNHPSILPSRRRQVRMPLLRPHIRPSLDLHARLPVL